MNADAHCKIGRRIGLSLTKLRPDDFEMKIEAAMLAGTHWLNAALHRMTVTKPEEDVFHTYLLTVNEYRRLSVADDELIRALSEIEDMRPLFVRGNCAGGAQAADRALTLLSTVRAKAESE